MGGSWRAQKGDAETGLNKKLFLALEALREIPAFEYEKPYKPLPHAVRIADVIRDPLVCYSRCYQRPSWMLQNQVLNANRTEKALTRHKKSVSNFLRANPHCNISLDTKRSIFLWAASAWGRHGPFKIASKSCWRQLDHIFPGIRTLTARICVT